MRKLGIEVAKSTVEKYRIRPSKPSSPTWKAFLDHHLTSLVSIDFFIVPTVRFKLLFVLVVLAHERRRVIHFNVTENPTYAVDGPADRRGFPLGYRPKVSATGSRCDLWRGVSESSGGHGHRGSTQRTPESLAKSYVERLIGRVRRDCLDQVIVLNQHHLRKILTGYFGYYHRWRTLLSLAMDTPSARVVHPPDMGAVVEFPEVGGLHHHYERIAA